MMFAAVEAARPAVTMTATGIAWAWVFAMQCLGWRRCQIPEIYEDASCADFVSLLWILSQNPEDGNARPLTLVAWQVWRRWGRVRQRLRRRRR